MPATAPAKAAAIPVWPLQSPAALNAMFGNPDANGDGKPDPKWEAANIIQIEPPFDMIWAFDTDADGKLDDPVRRIRVHRLAAEPLLAFLNGIEKLYGSQKAIEKVNMHRFGGAYNFRVKRGNSKSLSTHSWGIAWDMDPANNGYKTPYKPGRSIPMEVVAIGEKLGATWGGRWNPADAMHFQLARTK